MSKVKGRWVGVKDVREKNSEQFIQDFRNAKRCAVIADETGKAFEVKKVDIWYVAQRAKILYRMSDNNNLFVL